MIACEVIAQLQFEVDHVEQRRHQVLVEIPRQVPDDHPAQTLRPRVFHLVAHRLPVVERHYPLLQEERVLGPCRLVPKRDHLRQLFLDGVVLRHALVGVPVRPVGARAELAVELGPVGVRPAVERHADVDRRPVRAPGRPGLDAGVDAEPLALEEVRGLVVQGGVDADPVVPRAVEVVRHQVHLVEYRGDRLDVLPLDHRRRAGHGGREAEDPLAVRVGVRRVRVEGGPDVPQEEDVVLRVVRRAAVGGVARELPVDVDWNDGTVSNANL